MLIWTVLKRRSHHPKSHSFPLYTKWEEEREGRRKNLMYYIEDKNMCAYCGWSLQRGMVRCRCWTDLLTCHKAWRTQRPGQKRKPVVSYRHTLFPIEETGFENSDPNWLGFPAHWNGKRAQCTRRFVKNSIYSVPEEPCQNGTVYTCVAKTCSKFKSNNNSHSLLFFSSFFLQTLIRGKYLNQAIQSGQRLRTEVGLGSKVCSKLA